MERIEKRKGPIISVAVHPSSLRQFQITERTGLSVLLLQVQGMQEPKKQVI